MTPLKNRQKWSYQPKILYTHKKWQFIERKFKKWQKSVKNGQNWPKMAKIGNFHRFFDIFSKFNNFANIFLTNKFDPGNERFKQPLSYKINTLGSSTTVFSVFSVKKRQNLKKSQKIAKNLILAKNGEKFEFA